MENKHLNRQYYFRTDGTISDLPSKLTEDTRLKQCNLFDYWELQSQLTKLCPQINPQQLIKHMQEDTLWGE